MMIAELDTLPVAGRMMGTQSPTLPFQLMVSTSHAPLAEGFTLWMCWLKMLKAAGESLAEEGNYCRCFVLTQDYQRTAQESAL